MEEIKNESQTQISIEKLVYEKKKIKKPAVKLDTLENLEAQRIQLENEIVKIKYRLDEIKAEISAVDTAIKKVNEMQNLSKDELLNLLLNQKRG